MNIKNGYHCFIDMCARKLLNLDSKYSKYKKRKLLKIYDSPNFTSFCIPRHKFSSKQRKLFDYSQYPVQRMDYIVLKFCEGLWKLFACKRKDICDRKFIQMNVVTTIFLKRFCVQVWTNLFKKLQKLWDLMQNLPIECDTNSPYDFVDMVMSHGCWPYRKVMVLYSMAICFEISLTTKHLRKKDI